MWRVFFFLSSSLRLVPSYEILVEQHKKRHAGMECGLVPTRPFRSVGKECTQLPKQACRVWPGSFSLSPGRRGHPASCPRGGGFRDNPAVPFACREGERKEEPVSSISFESTFHLKPAATILLKHWLEGRVGVPFLQGGCACLCLTFYLIC